MQTLILRYKLIYAKDSLLKSRNDINGIDRPQNYFVVFDYLIETSKLNFEITKITEICKHSQNDHILRVRVKCNRYLVTTLARL